MTRELPVEVWRLVANKLTPVEFCLVMMTSKSIKNLRYGVPLMPVNKLPPLEAYVEYAASNCSPDLLSWLLQNNFPVSSAKKIINSIVARMSLPLFKVAQKFNIFTSHDSEWVIISACTKGWDQLLEYLYNMSPFIFKEAKCGTWWLTQSQTYSAENGHVQCLEFFCKIGVPIDPIITKTAAKKGNINILQFAHDNNIGWHKEAVQDACHNRQFDALKFIHEHGGKLQGYRLCRDSTECAEYVHQHGYACEHTQPERSDYFNELYDMTENLDYNSDNNSTDSDDDDHPLLYNDNDFPTD